MSIFSFITLFGGLALFLFGMNQMSASLEKLAGGKMEAILNKMTSNRFAGLALGAAITIAIQSSSAVTVMLVGLVNSGIMDIGNTVGVIMGSNIGTTVTAWIMSLIGVSSSNVFVRMLKPESFSPIMALIGVIMMMTCKSSKKKDIGNILVGFAVLMYGMTFMSSSVAPLAHSPKFETLLTAFRNPFLGILVGLTVTAVIQSSAASVGMLQALALTGSITWDMAIPIIMGQNIGTCATALISSIGVNRNAKRVAAIHISFNIIGTIIFMVIYFIVNATIDLPFLSRAIAPVGVAMFHSVFNICTTAMLLPFTKQLVKLAKRIVKTEPEKQVAFLDERLLKTPSVAIAECSKQENEMALLSKDSLVKAMNLLLQFDEKEAEGVRDLEAEVDVFEDHIGSYLVKVSGNELSDHDGKEVSLMLHTISNFERISDHALNVMQTAQELHDKRLKFSDMAYEELDILVSAMTEILDITYTAFTESDYTLAQKIEPLEEVIDGMTERIKSNHTERLKNGTCTIQNGFILNDLLNDLERASDHCSNIGVAMIELRQYSFDTHEYLEEAKDMSNPVFRGFYEMFKDKYYIKKFIPVKKDEQILDKSNFVS
ncbi:MAG: Na/Pi cotransporter family protein [Clostridiales bacterium]|jgi:phosphate:Na+ symporter|nr:Na/Pi cotransporter family protein [Clostridiales bacterium]